ncbi:delta-like protein 3 [Ditylenchus destructor]|nr:delta-like protein 3 [Ditylenchus destructor]
MNYVRSSSLCGCNHAHEAIVKTVENASEQNIPGHVIVMLNTLGNFVISKNAQTRNNVLAMGHATALHKLIHASAILLIMGIHVKMSTQLSKIVIEETVLTMATAPVQMHIQSFVGVRCEQTACNDNDQCNGHGKCEGTTQQFTCSCNTGYSGNKCEIADPNVIPCDNGDCHNHGKCEGVKAKFSCKCDNGYVGNTCADTPCDNGACNGHGSHRTVPLATMAGMVTGVKLRIIMLFLAMEVTVITMEVAVVRKTAPLVLVIRVFLAVDARIKIATIKLIAMVTELALEQYKMQLASVAKAIQAIIAKKEIPCDRGDCNNHGNCDGSKNSPKCSCDSGFQGDRCEKTLCTSQAQCNSHGACNGTADSYTCTCSSGWSGKNCETGDNTVTSCDRSDCSEHGNCTGMKSAPKCTCDSGRTGTHCEKETPCDSSDCSNHGTCTGSKANPTCTCDSGYCGSKCGDSCNI